MNRKRLIVIAVVLVLGIAAYLWASSRPKTLVASGTDRKSTRLNSSHPRLSRMPSCA